MPGQIFSMNCFINTISNSRMLTLIVLQRSRLLRNEQSENIDTWWWFYLGLFLEMSGLCSGGALLDLILPTLDTTQNQVLLTENLRDVDAATFRRQIGQEMLIVVDNFSNLVTFDASTHQSVIVQELTHVALDGLGGTWRSIQRQIAIKHETWADTLAGSLGCFLLLTLDMDRWRKTLTNQRDHHTWRIDDMCFSGRWIGHRLLELVLHWNKRSHQTTRKPTVWKERMEVFFVHHRERQRVLIAIRCEKT